MARTLAVTAVARPVFPSYTVSEPTPQTVRNTGAATIYLGEDDMMAPYSGVPLSPGSSVLWDADRALYAMCDPGKTSTLNYSDNQGFVFDAGAIAGEIIAQGLAVDIADAIQLRGAPPIDPMIVIGSATFITTAARQTLVVDASQYQSVFITVREHGLVTNITPVPRRIQAAWGVGAFVVYDAEQFYVTDDKGSPSVDVGYVTYQTMVKNAVLHVDVDPTTVTGNAVDVIVSGSYKTLAESRYVNRSAYFGALGTPGAFQGTAMDGVANYLLAAKAGAPSIQEYPPTKAGPCTVTLSMSTVTVTGDVFVQDAVNANAIYAYVHFPVAAVAQVFSLPIHLPARPITFGAQTGLAGTFLRMTTVYEK